MPEAHRENRANDLVVAADVIEEINTSVVRTANKICNRLNSTYLILTVSSSFPHSPFCPSECWLLQKRTDPLGSRTFNLEVGGPGQEQRQTSTTTTTQRPSDQLSLNRRTVVKMPSEQGHRLYVKYVRTAISHRRKNTESRIFNHATGAP